MHAIMQVSDGNEPKCTHCTVHRSYEPKYKEIAYAQ